MICTEKNFTTITALNDFYLRKLGQLTDKNGVIYSTAEADNTDYESKSYALAVDVMYQSMSIMYGILIGLDNGKIENVCGIMKNMVNKRIDLLTENYRVVLERIKKERGVANGDIN
jgi:hypothetical protein